MPYRRKRMIYFVGSVVVGCGGGAVARVPSLVASCAPLLTPLCASCSSFLSSFRTVASGATGNPAILVYSTKMAPTERPDIGYAMIFPSMTLVKVIAAQIVGLLRGRRRGRIMAPLGASEDPRNV